MPDRPALLPGLVCVTRDDSTLQIGVEPPHAIVVHGAGRAHARVLSVLDGRHDRTALQQVAHRAGLSAGGLDDLLMLLARHRLLVTFGVPGQPTEMDPDEVARLEPDLTALALHHVDAVGGAWEAARSLLRRRAAAWVEVHGAGRVGAGIATLLAAAGVGWVSVVDGRRSGPADASPLGLPRDAVGAGRESAVRARVAAASASTRSSAPPPPRRPDLCVLAPDTGPSAPLAAAWSRRLDAHLLAYVRETVGVVGPLVVPGRSACLSCLDLHRRDRDPGWPRVATQLAHGPARPACDVALAALVAAQGCMQALAFLDGEVVSTWGASVEVTHSGTALRRRVWPAHPACGCHWPTDAPDSPSATGDTRTGAPHAGPGEGTARRVEPPPALPDRPRRVPQVHAA